ncbi:hypothetical protein [Geobacillus jurassicus]|uniref:hypothetical protein n=1 Tax=Geobacillus jurassicus TaxID=235932 RepID=UPI0036D3794D
MKSFKRLSIGSLTAIHEQLAESPSFDGALFCGGRQRRPALFCPLIAVGDCALFVYSKNEQPLAMKMEAQKRKRRWPQERRSNR